MSAEWIQPFVRFARRQDTAPTGGYFAAYDHRLFFCMEGEAHIEVDGREYTLTQDSFLIWHSGLPYRYLSFRSFRAIALNFDMTNRHSSLISPISPDSAESFDRKKQLESLPFPLALPDVIVSSYKGEPTHLPHRILEEFSSKRIGCETFCSSLLAILLIQLKRALLTERSGSQSATADEIIGYIRKHLTEELSYESLGKLFHYHPNHINRMIRLHTGMSFHGYVRHCRTELAIRLLETESLSVGEIAAKLRYADIKSFSRCFKLATGHPPSYYRTEKP